MYREQRKVPTAVNKARTAIPYGNNPLQSEKREKRVARISRFCISHLTRTAARTGPDAANLYGSFIYLLPQEMVQSYTRSAALLSDRSSYGAFRNEFLHEVPRSNDGSRVMRSTV